MYILRAELLDTASKLSSSGVPLYMKWNPIRTPATPENVLYYKYGLIKSLVRARPDFGREWPLHVAWRFYLLKLSFVLFLSTRYHEETRHV